MKRKTAKPDFDNFLKALNGKSPHRPVLFEFIINDKIINYLTDEQFKHEVTGLDFFKKLISAYYNGGYDFVSIPAWETKTLSFPKRDKHKENSISLNEGWLINDEGSFEKYNWPDPDDGDYSIYHQLSGLLPEGMKILICSNGGVLENVIDLVGFENLCFLSLTDERLTSEVFKAVGTRLVKYYENLLPFECIGACMVNDDWGFKTQTMLSTEDMRKYVFPWHEKIVEVIHNQGKPAILHSCGNLGEVMDDVINEIGFDAKHSFEDEIIPVEDAYDRWGERIAIMGGIDMNFLATSSPEEIHKRARSILEKTADKGRYALGSGNSIPDFIPVENYQAMIDAAREI